MNKLFDYMRDGVSQSERKLDALLPSYVKIDERSQEDLLLFLSELATQFNYYNFQHEIEGDWSEFLQADVLIMVTAISRLDFTRWQEQHSRIQTALESVAGDAGLHALLAALFNLIFNIANQIASHLHQLRKADQQGLTWTYTDQLIEGITEDVLQMLQYEEQAMQLFTPVTHFRTIQVTDELAANFPSLAKKRAHTPPVFLGYQSLNEVYNRLRKQFYQITSAAQFYLRRRPDELQHHPHIGLMMAFTRLYSHLQDKLNRLTGQHLDYYYRHVLGLQQKPAVPDQVHIFIDAQPQSMPFTVPRGTAMMVETGNGAPPVTYKLNNDLRVSHAQIKTLKSVYVNSYKQISAQGAHVNDIIESQVYAATHPVHSPGDYAPGTLTVDSWSIFGEPQHELAREQRTMQEVDMGVLLASPLLYLTEGKRTIELSLFFEPASFKQLLDYISNFSQVTGKRDTLVMNELLSSAFIISYTTAEGWNTLPKHSIRSSTTAGGTNAFYITIVYDVNAPAAAIYDPALHGGAYQTNYPLLRLLLNNNSAHHPYSFLPLLWLERISIRAKVKGYRSVKLFNNAGPLSPANPFQLFGPQPSTGSFLDMRDSNVFNIYTRTFRVNLEWLELPHVENGFDEYYAAYEAGMTNESFVAGISAFDGGQLQPERNQQQQLQLFSTYRDEEGRIRLSDKSTLTNIDLKKINFHNRPLLDKEPFIADGFYNDGAVRLELAGPKDAFGHRTYVRLFPEILTHNAGRWVKKKPIPNMPYTPLVKSISIDYVLEQAEILKPEKAEDPSPSLQLFHLYPFGHRKVYPSSVQGDFSLLPTFDDKASMYIGLDGMRPQEEISILFQLEEKHRNHTRITKAPKLHWSYLANDRWEPFNKSQMLADTTQLFINSGIITLKMPSANSYGNTRLDQRLQWIRLSSVEEMEFRPMVKGIFVNAGIACREQSDTIVSTTLPAMSIKAFQQEMKGVQRVWQLFPSFGGRPAETKEEYYVRVSERLRHKNRPLTSMDIIQLILEAFPEILIVKCVSNISYADVLLVAVPKPANNGRYENMEPHVDIATLYRINKFLKKLLPPFINVHIHHPVYEKVKIVCDVCFVEDISNIDTSYYLNRLQQDISQYLSPWLFDTTPEVTMGGAMYTADMLSFIKKLPYVSYVTGFSMVHFFEEMDEDGNYINCMLDTAASNVEYVRASSAEAVLIPAPHHSIQVVREWDYREPAPIGISGVIAGEEMIVGQHERTEYKGDDDSYYTDGEIISLTIHPK
ncbi:baseplate J/gp47 family protein [Chitinophaga agri]|uniref:Baseplate protein J-like domain-containing protein n=1 Tax=Chitinophaga agri TaxID=2703787 RepID=A0A6B9ZC15_9BACT|nr:hypothetical protein [Chitinophaga agri]QHS58854.1 hypothetical protein GWR21_04320 [Chitinophaga agri]